LPAGGVALNITDRCDECGREIRGVPRFGCSLCDQRRRGSSHTYCNPECVERHKAGAHAAKEVPPQK